LRIERIHVLLLDGPLRKTEDEYSVRDV
jgi:hypothetical protein